MKTPGEFSARCCDVVTTDRAVFEEHMLVIHRRHLAIAVPGESGRVERRAIKRGWRTPSRMALTKDAAAATRACPTCELVAEVTTNASDLWWTEHLRGCAIATAGATT